MSPAMAAGLADRIWSTEDIVRLVEDAERKAIEAGALKPGPCPKVNQYPAVRAPNGTMHHEVFRP